MGRDRIAAVEAKHRKRGRPRSAEADAAIERATLELLPEHGLRGLSMEEVARRAGVSKATLYRRFSSKKELVEAALRAIRTAEPPPDTGSVPGDLVALFERERSAAAWVPDIARLAAKLLADSADDASLFGLARRTLVAFDRRAIRKVLSRGIERGELRQDIDVGLATDILHGSLVYRFLLSGQGIAALRPSYVRRLVETILTGFALPERTTRDVSRTRRIE
jgi:AcrR family transcriptional regulator